MHTQTEWTLSTYEYRYKMDFEDLKVYLQNGLSLLMEYPYRMDFHYLWNTPTEWTFTTYGIPLQNGLSLLMDTSIGWVFYTREYPCRMGFH